MAKSFGKAKKTFLGYLQARGKALNTVKNYGFDLATLEAFCKRNRLKYHNLSQENLDAYHDMLKGAGLRTNSRRRKLVTAKAFIRYLSGRMDIATIGAERVVLPEKVEKPPKLVPREVIGEIIKRQPETELGWRNRALIGLLFDTGMLVSEVLILKKDDIDLIKDGAVIRVVGKRARTVRAGALTAEALMRLRDYLKGTEYYFYGYSRAGRNAERLTTRGVELLFRAWADEHQVAHLHPRTLRHLFVVGCISEGKSQAEIMEHIGLRTPYAFRVYKNLRIQ